MARCGAFVGRADELATFQHALDAAADCCMCTAPAAPGRPFLLRQFAWLAEKAGRRVRWVDGRDLGRQHTGAGRAPRAEAAERAAGGHGRAAAAP